MVVYIFNKKYKKEWKINSVSFISFDEITIFNKKIKKFKVIYEVEEIHTDVSNDSNLKRKREKIIDKANKYIFPTELLDKEVNINKKPFSIIYGTYKIEKNMNLSFNDNKIHLVYAAIFYPRKGGSTAVPEYLG